jgi:hypothetical protein
MGLRIEFSGITRLPSFVEARIQYQSLKSCATTEAQFGMSF